MPNCRECPHMRVTGYANVTANNRYRGKHPRGYCMCEHPRAAEVFHRLFSRSSRLACFIGFTSMNDEKPQIKTCPKWCPLKNAEG